MFNFGTEFRHRMRILTRVRVNDVGWLVFVFLQLSSLAHIWFVHHHFLFFCDFACAETMVLGPTALNTCFRSVPLQQSLYRMTYAGADYARGTEFFCLVFHTFLICFSSADQLYLFWSFLILFFRSFKGYNQKVLCPDFCSLHGTKNLSLCWEKQLTTKEH